jgi:hypothetical protein
MASSTNHGFNQSLLWPKPNSRPAVHKYNFLVQDLARLVVFNVFLLLPQEREISSSLIERKGLLSYQDGFGGRK